MSSSSLRGADGRLDLSLALAPYILAELKELEAKKSKCRSGCPTPGAHQSWGACMRAANVSTMVGDGVQINRQGEKDLAAYASLRRQGLQPQSVRRPFVEATKKAAGA